MTEINPGISYNISGEEVTVNRPEPIFENMDVVPYDRTMDPKEAIEAIINGYAVLIVDYYSSGLALMNELKKHVKLKHPGESFQGQRDFRAEFQSLSRQILLLVRNAELTVKKAPEIGWFKILYPGLDKFLLPFTQVQGLNSSWQWYTKGLTVPVLKNKIHPFFGTYFPTRFEHLLLFESWLKRYQGEKKSAIDVGIGCGVLSFQLLNHQFEKVFGTDINPNAIYGLHEYLKELEEQRIDLIYGDLFGENKIKSELIVFNPPWLPVSDEPGGLDEAVYYSGDLFSRFFDEATKHLLPGGKIVLLFSNLAQITHLTHRHPIKEELANGDRYEKELLLKKGVKPASKKTKRKQNWRSAEVVELWVLKLKD